MIKNFLYSLFLHFLLLLVIYANFNLKKFDESKTSEIAVSLIAMDGDENSSKANSAAKEEETDSNDKKPKKEEAQIAKSQKKSLKNKVSEDPKKLAKSKPVKAIKKPIPEEKLQEFKHPEKAEEKQEDSPKLKEDKEKNEEQDKEEKKVAKKEKDLGAAQTANQNQNTKNEQNPKKSDAAELANNVENIDLSAREKFNIQSQLKRCYRRAIDETKLMSNIKIMVKVQISEEGYIESDIDEMIDMERYNNPTETGYKIVIDNVRRAIDLCSPLRNLPLDKYDVWKEAVLEFDENQ